VDHEQLNGVWHLIRALLRARAKGKGTGSIDQCSVPYPDDENHRSACQWNPQGSVPPSAVASHLPTQQGDKGARREGHGPFANEERRVDAIQLLVQEIQEQSTILLFLALIIASSTSV
jgi:hypothetical protein